MSAVYWHSPQQTVSLRGSERAWLSHVARGPAVAAWDFDVRHERLDRAADLLGMVPAGRHHLGPVLQRALDERAAYQASWEGLPSGQRSMRRFDPEPERELINAINVVLAVQGLEVAVAGVRLHTQNVDLNTAIAAGSDVVQLAAKIDAWCESHAWVEGPDRAWLAGIIKQGLAAGIYRRVIRRPATSDHPDGELSSQGWDDVLALLAEHDDEPVVMSYSVCDQFPNEAIAGWSGDAQSWYDMPAAEQWRSAMDGLRASRPWARLAPDTLTEVTFHHPVTIYDLLAPDRDDRVRRAAQESEA